MTRRARNAAVALSALALVASQGVAFAGKDYTRNASTGDAAPVIRAATPGVTGAGKDYSRNASTGDAAPVIRSATVASVSRDGGFAWGAAATGAGVALAAGTVALGAAAGMRRRRHGGLAS